MENEKLLQEIRRLNLKNVELSEQVGQLIQCGIEQFEEYDKAAEKATEKTESSYEAYANSVKEEIKKTEDVQKAGLVSIENALKSLSDKISGGGINEAVTEEIKKLTETISQEIKKLTESVAEENKKISESVAEENKKITESIVEENKKITESIIEENKKITETVAEEVKKLSETTKALEDYVHKENVKVYRNVQAVVVEQASQKTRELGDRLDALEKNSRKGSGLLPLVVMTFLVAAISLVLQLAQMLQIF